MFKFASLNAFSQIFAKVTVDNLRMYTQERRALFVFVFGLILHACTCAGIHRIKF